ncbi:MRPS36 [Acanthosepion pharaonis]|uniref:MRPS36 n=1 Tax=Acanthosepion pharaonis TaxID=158019 RepID=A0A812CGM2_ACAPH|nr:MRPS36 [Sepia pharaonis]
MAAAGARTIRVVKPHVPLIKFPTRKVNEPLKMVNISVANPGQMLVSTPDVTSKPVGSMPRGSGIEWSQLPAKYHRKPLSQEEIEFIECPLGAASLYLVTPSAAPHSTSSSSTRMVERMQQGSGIEWSQMPDKYHRKQLTTEEIEFIERGGPA